MTKFHKTVDLIKNLLNDQGCEYKCFVHQPVRTSEEAAAIRPEYSLAQGAKALLLRLKKKAVPKEQPKQFVQIVVPGDAKFDPKKARMVLEAKDLRFASEAEVLELTDGVLPGGVPPFGNLWDLPVYVDESLLTNQEIIFNAGDKRYSIAMKSEDYLQVVKPTVVGVV